MPTLELWWKGGGLVEVEKAERGDGQQNGR